MRLILREPSPTLWLATYIESIPGPLRFAAFLIELAIVARQHR